MEKDFVPGETSREEMESSVKECITAPEGIPRLSPTQTQKMRWRFYRIPGQEEKARNSLRA